MAAATMTRGGVGGARSGEDGAGDLRILHVVESFHAGTYSVVRRLASGQAAAGADVTVAFARRAATPANLDREFGPGVRLAELPWPGRGPLACARAGRALRRVEAEIEPDLVHLHSTFAGLVGGLALRGPAPRIFSPHGPASAAAGPAGTRWARRGLDRLILRRTDLLGAVSAWEADVLAPLGPRRTVVVLNGIDELDHPAGPGSVPKPGRLRVIATGRMAAARRPKAVARILNAVSDLADVRWVGGKPAGAGDLDGVPVTGWLPREQVLDALRGADLYLHWSALDTTPTAVLEAMACDAVVVASDIPPNREVLGDAQVCADEGEAIELIRSLLSDGARRRELLRRQHGLRSRFGAARMVREWLSVYRSLLGAPRPSTLRQ